jgi:ferredoxin
VVDRKKDAFLERNFYLLSDFRSHIQFLRRFKVLTLAELAEVLAAPPKKLKPAVVIAFDDGYANNLLVGIEVRTGVRVGEGVSLEQLREEFEAVLVACGEATEAAAAALGLALHGKGLAHDRDTLMTEKPGVFVAGSALTPSPQAVRSVGSGRLAAQAIGQYLAGEPVHVEHRPYTVLMGRLDPGEMALYAEGSSPADRIEPAGGERLGFDPAERQAEAARCLQCACEGVNCCLLRKWGHAYEANPHHIRLARRSFERDRSHPNLTYEPGKCISCGLCVQIAEGAREEFGLAFIGRGFRVRIGVPFDETLADGLRKVTRECAAACPTAALMWREAAGQDATGPLPELEAQGIALASTTGHDTPAPGEEGAG